MLNIIVFSKDRACQLELFLRSMKYYFKEFYESKINVLYTYSNDSFKNGYDKLIEIHNDDNINYIKETTNFKNHVLMLLDPKKDYSGYPMSLDGHFFRTSDILPLTRAIQFKNPNSYESILAGYPLNRPKMICFEDSIIINNPINKVQDFNNNHHGNISADFLNDKFLEGKIVDLEDFKGIKNTAVHQEIDVNFIDYEKK
jgi:hypothetical protein